MYLIHRIGLTDNLLRVRVPLCGIVTFSIKLTCTHGYLRRYTRSQRECCWRVTFLRERPSQYLFFNIIYRDVTWTSHKYMVSRKIIKRKHCSTVRDRVISARIGKIIVGGLCLLIRKSTSPSLFMRCRIVGGFAPRPPYTFIPVKSYVNKLFTIWVGIIILP